MHTISVILGTRPEAIKLAPVIRALRAAKGVRCDVCVTAQHRQMLDQVLDVFGIVPDTDLNLMRRSQSLAGFASLALREIDRYLVGVKPSLVMVQGDTSTVFCAALAAFYRGIPVGHVEAGLRTWNLQAPWPEEANRVLTSRLAAVHFAPTRQARDNLLREGVSRKTVHVTGNTVIDALLHARGRVCRLRPSVPGLPAFLQPGARKRPAYVLITGHRRENFGAGFENICRAIRQLADRFPEAHFVYPVHLNPRVRTVVRKVLSDRGRTAPNIHLIEPVSYLPFVALMNGCTGVLTDSGGIQEEAPSLGKPVLVMREVTERPEALAAGTARLVGTDCRKIVREVSRLLESSGSARRVRASNPYGDGQAARRIIRICRQFLE
jgi:UDP-N-acetylglucosamine 2-epimerase (non-hydrolysing)